MDEWLALISEFLGRFEGLNSLRWLSVVIKLTSDGCKLTCHQSFGSAQMQIPCFSLYFLFFEENTYVFFFERRIINNERS